ncbi:mitochondrial 2-enoyl thioester reductase [Spiromyces aspiralis]|uniref:Mitochondrial 2-enoyl thioester reductase n=1 Tax=Spiromyces aspiralis TaxID=68401 RepID=A0ACC1HGC2_9FUNG|nr:mitochondrial 2-enoyl thioester reductase [Spiromyces aspiralis]
MLRASLSPKLINQSYGTHRLPKHSLAAVYAAPGDPPKVLRTCGTSPAKIALPDTIPEGKALIKMLAAPVNPSDLNQIEGIYPVKGQFAPLPLAFLDGKGDPTVARAAVDAFKDESVAIGGNEGVAEVIALGRPSSPSPVSSVNTGDWVLPARSGVFVSIEDLIPIPDHHGLAPEQVATIKVNPSTAYRMLRDFVELQPGDYVIQNGANSGVGRAVIQLCREWGYRTINVVRDRDNFDELAQDLRGLGATMVVRDTELKSESLANTLKELENPIRLGLNCVGGRPTLAMTAHISRGGVLVTYGGMSRQPVTLPTSYLIFKDITARGFWMTRWYKANRVQERWEMWNELLGLMHQGKLVNPPMSVVQWSEATEPSELAARLAQAVDWGKKHAFKFN